MARIRKPAPAEMSPEQTNVYDEAAAGPRGYAPALLDAWLQNPELARRSQKLGEVVRFGLSLPARLRELAILVVARYWSAHHEWRIHKKIAVESGISEGIVADITGRRRPTFTSDADQVVYDVAISLLETRSVPEDLYQRGVQELGERGMVELVSVIGYYTYVSMTLTTFEIGLPEGLQTELLDKNFTTQK